MEILGQTKESVHQHMTPATRHRILDQLLADFLRANPDATLSTPILTLLNWSHSETTKPKRVKTLLKDLAQNVTFHPSNFPPGSQNT